MGMDSMPSSGKTAKQSSHSVTIKAGDVVKFRNLVSIPLSSLHIL